MRLSKHSRKRMNERTDLKKRSQKGFFRKALNNGLDISEFKENPIVFEYIREREEKYKCKIKLYKGYTFCYGKNSKLLYTMYKTPRLILSFMEEKK